MFRKIFAVLIFLFLTFGARAAEAVKIEAAGLPNFYKVSDNLYRGAQPDAEGFAKLPSYGIKTVINLRAIYSDKKFLKDSPLNYKTIPIYTWNFKEKYIEEFLTIIADPDNLPVFVHCQHGSDRTGTMVAVYRIVVEGWSKEDAISEMTKGPYGFHKIWGHLPKLINSLDAERLKTVYNTARAAALQKEKTAAQTPSETDAPAAVL